MKISRAWRVLQRHWTVYTKIYKTSFALNFADPMIYLIAMGMGLGTFVNDIHGQGVTVLLVEQNTSRALALANRGYVMDSGEITMSGDAKQLLNDPKVRAAYLGE